MQITLNRAGLSLELKVLHIIKRGDLNEQINFIQTTKDSDSIDEYFNWALVFFTTRDTVTHTV